MYSNKLFLFAAVVIVFFTSCEKQEDERPNEEPEPSTALAGTTWEGWKVYIADFVGIGRTECEMVFSSTTVDCSYTDKLSGEEEYEIHRNFTGTYTYYPPEVTITVTSPEHLAGLINTGTVETKLIEGEEKEIMSIVIHLDSDYIDWMWLVEQ